MKNVKIAPCCPKRLSTVPFLGVLFSGKKAFAVFGGCNIIKSAGDSPQNGGFLFSEKSFYRNRDCCINRCKNVYVHFQPILILKKNVVKVDDVFAIYFQERVGVI